jgi:DNA adenine methylase
MIKHILKLMPKHLVYVEPFFGGGKVLFARDPADPRLWWPGPDSDGRPCKGVSEVVNDLHGDLMAFYAVLQDPATFGQLRHRLDLTPPWEPKWEAARDLLAGPGGSRVERAAALFTLCRLSRSGKMESFCPPVRNRLRGGRNELANAWWNAIEGLEAVHLRLRDVVVLNRPALGVIRAEDTPATLFYCDPPYLPETRTAPKVYAWEMTRADHQELLDALRAVRGMVILSGYANGLYDTALAGWNRHDFDLPNNAAGGRGKRRMTEVLWSNF